MKRQGTGVIVAAVVLGLASPGFAKSPPVKPAAAGPAAPAPEIRKTVEAFVGDWISKTTTTMPGAAPVKAKIPNKCRSVAADSAVVCESQATVPGVGELGMASLVSYDRESKEVYFMAVSSMGIVQQHKCTWKDDKHLDCRPLAATMMGQPVTKVLSMDWPDARTSHFKSATTMKDGKTVTFEGTGTRK